MSPWIVLGIGLLFGVFFGILLYGLIAVDSRDRNEEDKAQMEYLRQLHEKKKARRKK